MCFFDHSFAHNFLVFHFVAKPMLEFRENMTFFRVGSGEVIFSGLVPKHC